MIRRKGFGILETAAGAGGSLQWPFGLPADQIMIVHGICYSLDYYGTTSVAASKASISVGLETWNVATDSYETLHSAQWAAAGDGVSPPPWMWQPYSVTFPAGVPIPDDFGRWSISSVGLAGTAAGVSAWVWYEVQRIDAAQKMLLRQLRP